MQYTFASHIKKIVGGISNLQTLVTTHSSHIVSQCDFEDIRYLQKFDNHNIVIKNFFTDLRNRYAVNGIHKISEEDAEKHLNFLVKYLTIQSAELFFADKIIFIEGTTERILLPYFIRLFDECNNQPHSIPLAAQHISILEVGANARVFEPFLNFLGVKVLVITDLDSTKQVKKPKKKGVGESVTYDACPVIDSTHTSNYTLKHFFSAPEIDKEDDYAKWYKKLKSNAIDNRFEKILVTYQTQEDGYHARSFEDAFLHINKDNVKEHLESLSGLKNKSNFNDKSMSTYDLTNSVIEKKSDFASSLLFLALTNNAEKKFDWRIPKYIQDSLIWLSQ